MTTDKLDQDSYTTSGCGLVIWITGFSGAGKTTISKVLVDQLKRMGKPVVLLDGDQIRSALNPHDDELKELDSGSRLAYAMKYSRISAMLARQDLVVVVATISLFSEIHSWNRENISNYFEVYLDVPLSERQNRDPKGIYSRYHAGLERNVAGLDMDVELPRNPDLTISYTHEMSSLSQANMILNGLEELGKI